jgi:UDP-3-O-[3-hydroxymyristoyl] glucosamine N-acyltransferase
MTLQELADRLGARLEPGSDGDAPIVGVAPLAEANPGDLSFFGHPKYLKALKGTRATAVLVPESFEGEAEPVLLRVADPAAAFAAILPDFTPEPWVPAPGIHPAAMVDETARIGADCHIGPFAVVGRGAVVGNGCLVESHAVIGEETTLGEGCRIFPNVTIRERCRIGNRVVIHAGAVIGADGFGYEFRDGAQRKIPQTGTVQIDDDVEIGANTTIDRARFGRTLIGEGTKIDNLVMIAHNVSIGRHCIICAQVGISGSTRIGDHVTLAGQAGIVGHIAIGDGAIVGAQSGVSNDLAPKSVVVGSPPRPIGDWKRSIVRIDRLPELYSRVKKLERNAGE